MLFSICYARKNTVGREKAYIEENTIRVTNTGENSYDGLFLRRKVLNIIVNRGPGKRVKENHRQIPSLMPPTCTHRLCMHETYVLRKYNARHFARILQVNLIKRRTTNLSNYKISASVGVHIFIKGEEEKSRTITPLHRNHHRQSLEKKKKSLKRH